MFEKSFGIDGPPTKALLAQLTERLLKAVATASAPEKEHLIGALAKSYGNDFDTLVSLLRSASQRVQQEGVDVVPKPTREALRSALAEFHTALEGNTTRQ